MAGAILAVVAPTLSKAKAASLVGTSAVAICLAMFASPLSALKTVVQKKSSDSIPLPLSLATAVNCYLWMMVGIFGMKDANIIIPNALGLLFGFIQLALIAIYPSKGGKSKDNDVLPVSM